MNVSKVLVSGAAAVLRQFRLRRCSHTLRVVPNIPALGALVALSLVTSAQLGHAREPGQPRGCPKLWCGCYLAHYLGMPHRKDLWKASNWAKIGKPTRPKIGAVVVWRNHVGLIVGKRKDGWVIRSGNDGNRVRVRVRPVHKAIAFRQL